jgi:hypothetical protein
MNSYDLSKDLAFPGPGRLLQQTSNNTREEEDGSGSAFNVISGAYIVAMVLIVMIAAWCVSSIRRYVRAGTSVAIDAPTLAKRKQAVLELFETSQVTMVSNHETVMARWRIRINNLRKQGGESSRYLNQFRKRQRTIFMEKRDVSKT